MLKVTLNIRALRAVLVAVSTEETRYYLNGINLEFTPDGVIMAATDGHRMIILRQPYGEHGATGAHASVIVPRDLVAKLKIKLKTLDETTLTISDDGRLTFEHAGESFGGSRVDGAFPDYRRVVPQDLDGKPAQYNPQYLADFAKARQELTGSKLDKDGKGSPIVRYNGLNPAIVDFAWDTGFQAFGVIMPLRTTDRTLYYSWASAPAAAWPDAAPVTDAAAA
jgi:DNA polymerase III sliding clamp (beta) subunit (PCNA family)